MAYYNYHAMAKKLINLNHCIAVSIFKEYHHIRPAMVLYFDNHLPIPIREYMWSDYLNLIKDHSISIINHDNIPLT